MSKKYALVEYFFMLDPETGWASVYQFDKALADFFAAHGLEAEAVNTVNVGGPRMFLIKKMEVIVPEPKIIKGTTKQTFDKLRK